MGEVLLRHADVIASLVFVPGFALTMNLLARSVYGVPLSTGADILLFLFVVDFTLTFTPHPFSKLAVSPYVLNRWTLVFGLMSLLLLVIWYCLIKFVESPLTKNFVIERGKYEDKGQAFLCFVAVFVSVTVCMALQIAPFVVEWEVPEK